MTLRSEHGHKLFRGLGLKRPERSCRRWQLWVVQLDLRGKLPPRHAPSDFTTPVETSAPPISSRILPSWSPGSTMRSGRCSTVAMVRDAAW